MQDDQHRADMLPTAISQGRQRLSESALDREYLKPLLHSLANKLLPISVFCQLALREHDFARVSKHLERIHLAAEEARGIVVEMQRLDEQATDSVVPEAPSAFSHPSG